MTLAVVRRLCARWSAVLLAAARLVFMIFWLPQQTRTPRQHQNNTKYSLLHALIFYMYAFDSANGFYVSLVHGFLACGGHNFVSLRPFWVSPYTSPTDLNGRTKGPAYTSVSSHLQVFHCTCVFSGEPETHTHTLVIWFAFHGRKHSASSNLWCACRIEVCAWQSRGPKWSGNYIRSSMCRLLKNKTETFPSRSLCCASFCLCESSLPCQEKDLEIKRRNAWKCHRSTSVIPMFNAPMHISVIHKVGKAATFSFTSGHSGPNIQAQSFHATLESWSMVRTVQPNHKSSMLTRRCAVTFFQLWWNQKQKAKRMLDASMSLWRHSVAWNAWFLIQICEQPYESWVSSHHHFMI